MKTVFGRFRRSILIGLLVAGGGLFFLLGSANSASAYEEWALITNDPSPCTELLGACIGGTVQTAYDARQDATITLEAAVCRDDGFFDLCGDGTIGSVSLDGPDAIEVQWDMEGDGVVNSIDNNGGPGFGAGTVDGSCPAGTSWYLTTFCNLEISHPANFFKPSPADGWDLRARICGLGGSPCSGWERWSLAGIDTDYDVKCAPGKDNDADGVACEFEFPGGEVITNDDDRDNDAVYQRSALACVDADVAGIPAVDLEMGLFGDFSGAAVNNFCKKTVSILGNPVFTYFTGGFAWADVTVTSGSVELAMASLLTQNGVVSHNADGTVEAVVRGLGFCTDPDATTFFGSDLGFCNFTAMIQDDTDFLTQDEFSIRITGTGFFGTSFNKSYGFDGSGNRDAAESLASIVFDSFIITPG
ncbi:MAG: hypothetical protein IT198_15540 [Acidimicrobiia bacterium]|nr:hypothetical protein [Acidimicrobiia bacterium]